MQLMNERFGTMIDVAPTKAVLTEDPAKEMEVLTSMYLVPMGRGERAQQRTGRVAIVSTMREAFAEAGVLELMQRDLDVVKYTGPGDPFRIDFGYRVGSAVKMFHAVSLHPIKPKPGLMGAPAVAVNVDQALALAYRYSRVEAGMRQEQLQASLTAVVRPGDGVAGREDAVRDWDAGAEFGSGEVGGGDGGDRGRGAAGVASLRLRCHQSDRSCTLEVSTRHGESCAVLFWRRVLTTAGHRGTQGKARRAIAASGQMTVHLETPTASDVRMPLVRGQVGLPTEHGRACARHRQDGEIHEYWREGARR